MMILRPSLFRILQTCYIKKINYSSLPDDLIFRTNGMFVCWHPEPACPYEYTKPIPEVVPEPYSVLKATENDACKVFHKKLPQALIAEECAKLTYTTKHTWFPRSRDKKDIKIAPDRPYL